MRSIPADNVFKMELMLGQVKYVSPENGVCLIQPINEAPDPKGDTAVPGDIGCRLSIAAVKDTTIYRVNDWVLYARTAVRGLFSASAMDVAIILCRAPLRDCQYSDEPKIDEDRTGDAHDYYDQIETNFGRKYEDRNKNKPDARFINSSWLEEKIGGDRVFEGRNVLLRISDEMIRILGRNCGIHINSIDGSVVSHGVTLEFSRLGGSQRSVIINDTITEVNRSCGNTTRAYDPKTEVEKFDKETISGDVAYGEVTTLFGGTTPLAQVQSRSDGGYKAQSISGILFEKTDDIQAYRPKLTRSIIYDKDTIAAKDVKPDATQLHELGREPFDRIAKSELWEKAGKKKIDRTYLREPGDGYTPDGEDITDAEGMVMKTFKGRASWGVLPNGGFILRDAWGSEIRMSDGDIQISAARDILYTSGKDLIGVSGAVTAIHSGDGIQLGTNRGGVDISAAKDVNISGGTAVNMCGVATVNLFSEGTVVLGGGTTGGILLAAADVGISGSADVSIAGTRTHITGKSEVIAATPASVIALTGAAVSLGSGLIAVHGKAVLSAKEYKVGKVNDIDVTCSSSDGSLTVPGSVIVGEGIQINGDLSVSGGGAFGTLASSDCRAVEGGWGFGGRITKAPTKTKVSEPSSSRDTSKPSRAMELLTELKQGVEVVLSSMFSISRRSVNWILPAFSGKHKNTTKIGTPSSVDIKGKRRYIYPGERFWTTGGLTGISDNSTVPNVLYEVPGKPAEIKAEDLQLSKLEE